MPLDKSIKKTLVIGSGPIVIGQAAEFDYAGTQACRALREEGIEVVLVNSNPATIMTDKEMADRIYIASELNRIRWFDMTEDVSDSVTEMVEFLAKRIDFLNSAWIDGVEYYTLTLKQNKVAPFLYYCVPKNTDCISLPDPYELGLDGSAWYIEENGKIFDKEAELSSDLTLTAYVPDASTLTGNYNE